MIAERINKAETGGTVAGYFKANFAAGDVTNFTSEDKEDRFPSHYVVAGNIDITTAPSFTKYNSAKKSKETIKSEITDIRKKVSIEYATKTKKELLDLGYKTFSKSLNEMTLGEVIELSNRRVRFNQTGGGGAMGRYQFISSTLISMAEQLYGSNWKDVVFSTDVQEMVNLRYISNNAARLETAGLTISDASLYMMHFFGNTGQTKLVLEGNDDDSMKPILDKSGASAANPTIAAMTVKRYKDYLKSKGYNFEKVTKADLLKNLILPTPTRPTKTSFLDSIFIENQGVLTAIIDEEIFNDFLAQTQISQGDNSISMPNNSSLTPTQVTQIFDRPMIEQIGKFKNLTNTETNLYQKKISPIVRA